MNTKALSQRKGDGARRNKVGSKKGINNSRKSAVQQQYARGPSRGEVGEDLEERWEAACNGRRKKGHKEDRKPTSYVVGMSMWLFITELHMASLSCSLFFSDFVVGAWFLKGVGSSKHLLIFRLSQDTGTMQPPFNFGFVGSHPCCLRSIATVDEYNR